MNHNIDASLALEFYSKNDTIFITGGTGFIGVTIIEKVLRSLPQVKKDEFAICVVGMIYVLARVGPNTSIEDRHEKLLRSRVFDTLKASFSSDLEYREKIGSKIVLVQGDITLDDFGMNSSDILTVTSDTKVFIHSAASLNFDDPLKMAFNSYITSRENASIKIICSSSTAFVVPVSARTEGNDCMESIYPFLLGDPHEIFQKLKGMSDSEFSSYERDTVLKQYVNTYIFTKTLTEHLIQAKTNIPLVIVQPSIVTPALAEPVKGWAQGTAGPIGIMLTCGLGKIQEWAGRKDSLIDNIPVDIVSRLVLSGASTADRTVSPRIYNISMGRLNTLEIEKLAQALVKYWTSVKAPRKRSSDDICCKFYPMEEFQRRFNWKLMVPLIMAKLPGGRSIKKKLDKLYAISTTFNPFTEEDWLFDNTNSIILDTTAPPELRGHINRPIDWVEYYLYGCAGVHEFILHESVDRSMISTLKDNEISTPKAMFSWEGIQLQQLVKMIKPYWAIHRAITTSMRFEKLITFCEQICELCSKS